MGNTRTTRNPRKDAVTDDDQAFEQAAPTEALPEAEAAEPEVSEADRKKLRAEAYAAGVARLREENRDRFKELVKEEASKRGIEYVFQKTPEEKAAEEMKALLEKFPQLAGHVGG